MLQGGGLLQKEQALSKHVHHVIPALGHPCLELVKQFSASAVYLALGRRLWVCLLIYVLSAMLELGRQCLGRITVRLAVHVLLERGPLCSVHPRHPNALAVRLERGPPKKV